MRVELIALRSIRVGGTYFWVPALEFSTLMEVTEAGTIHVYASCTRPTRCTPVLLGFKGVKVKWGSKVGTPPPSTHTQTRIDPRATTKLQEPVPNTRYPHTY